MSESTSQWRLYGGSGKRQNLLESSRRSGDSPLKQGEFYCSKRQCETECYGGDPRRGRRHRQQDASNSLRSRNLWRWRELNPRPKEANQTFSGCSRLIVLLGSCTDAGILQTSPAWFESLAALQARADKQAS